MIRRLLGRMGLSGYIPGANDFGMDSRSADSPDAPLGEAQITFLGGAKTPYSADEEAARKELGDDIEADLVWPGKPTTMGLRNEEPLAYRYNLTITNLPADHYIIMPATGGERQPEGGVLLQPGEETTFEVRFPPIAREHLSPQSFHFVLTRFDPRRRNDPGVVVGEDSARWVPLPSANDFVLRADAGELRLRPWRRNAKFLLSLEDRCFLPSAANLHILRAPTRQALTEHAEQVDTISQSMEARTSGTWRCELPPTKMRTSCWVSVRGAVRVGEHQTVPVALPKPIYVRYVPWLRMGRDWAFLGASLFSLMWLVWGIPVRRAPVINLTVQFAGLPPGDVPNKNGKGSWDDLNFQIVSIDGTQLPKPIHGEPRGNTFVFQDLPKRWYGCRWPFNNWWSGRAPQSYKVIVTNDPDKSVVYDDYKLTKLKVDKKDAYPTDKSQFAISTTDRHFLGEWTLNPTATIPIAKAVRLNVTIDDNPRLKQAARQEKEVNVIWEPSVNGKGEARPVLPYEKQVVLDDITTDVLKPTVLKVYAVVDKVASEPRILKVELREEPYNIHLGFPPPARIHPVTGSYKPGESVSISGEGLGDKGDVFVGGQGLPVKPAWSAKGVSFTLPLSTPHGSAAIIVQPEGGEQLPAGTITVLEAKPVETTPPHYTVKTEPKKSSNNTLLKGKEGDARPAGSDLPLPPNKEAELAGKPGPTGTTSEGHQTGNNVPQSGGGNHTTLAPYTPQSDVPPHISLPDNKTTHGGQNGSNSDQGRNGRKLSASSASKDDFSAYEYFAMGMPDKAMPLIDAMLQSKNANTLASAHALKGMINLQNRQSADDEVSQAMSLSANQKYGRGLALAYLAQAQLKLSRGAKRDEMMQAYTDAIKADPDMALAYSEEYAYYLSQNMDDAAKWLYRSGPSSGRHDSALFHYLFACLFRKHGKQSEAQQEMQWMQNSERSAYRRQVFSDHAGRLNDS